MSDAALCSRDGGYVPLDVDRWHAEADAVDVDALVRVQPPVLDVGCGPGRLVVALLRQGVPALGVDVTRTAVATAHARGAMVLHRSVFDRVPGAGRWGTALLLDGNIGIGGEPAALLRRIRSLLRPGGRVLVEVDPAGAATRTLEVRVERGAAMGPWFRWAVVGADDMAALAGDTGFTVSDEWHAGSRWFAELARP